MVVGPHPGHTHSHQALLTKDIFDDHVAPDPGHTYNIHIKTNTMGSIRGTNLVAGL